MKFPRWAVVGATALGLVVAGSVTAFASTTGQTPNCANAIGYIRVEGRFMVFDAWSYCDMPILKHKVWATLKAQVAGGPLQDLRTDVQVYENTDESGRVRVSVPCDGVNPDVTLVGYTRAEWEWASPLWPALPGQPAPRDGAGDEAWGTDYPDLC